MKAAILDKITRELNNDIDTEPKVLYLLAEIRKYIDGYSQEEKNKYPNLKIFSLKVTAYQQCTAKIPLLKNAPANNNLPLNNALAKKYAFLQIE